MHGEHGGAGGIDSVAPRIGQLTAAVVLISFGTAVWFAITQPRSALIAVGLGTVISVLTGGANEIANPLIGLAAIGAGFLVSLSARPNRKSVNRKSVNKETK